MPNPIHGIIVIRCRANLVFALMIVINQTRAITRIAPTERWRGPWDRQIPAFESTTSGASANTSWAIPPAGGMGTILCGWTAVVLR